MRDSISHCNCLAQQPTNRTSPHSSGPIPAPTQMTGPVRTEHGCRRRRPAAIQRTCIHPQAQSTIKQREKEKNKRTLRTTAGHYESFCFASNNAPQTQPHGKCHRNVRNMRKTHTRQDTASQASIFACLPLQLHSSLASWDTRSRDASGAVCLTARLRIHSSKETAVHPSTCFHVAAADILSQCARPHAACSHPHQPKKKNDKLTKKMKDRSRTTIEPLCLLGHFTVKQTSLLADKKRYSSRSIKAVN